MENFLRNIPLFAELSEEDLAHLCSEVGEVTLEAGQVLFEEGAHGDRAYVVHTGELEIYKQSGGREVLLARRGPGEIIGEIALFEDAQRTASVRARDETQLIVISREQFDHLVQTSQHAAETLFYTVLTRLKDVQARLRQSEKMAQLGTLTAGVAHELNNPASAVRRGADRAGRLFGDFQGYQNELRDLELEAAQLEALEGLDRWMQDQARKPRELDTLLRADRSEELEALLEDLGVPEAWSLAGDLVDLGMDADRLRTALTPFTVDHREAVLRWLITGGSIQQLLYEIHAGAERISNIVAAMRSYSYLDRAPSQEVDIHKGIDDTLVILADKIKDKPGVSIRKEYDKTLPPIYGYGSELNQVWTNLLDNALDAVGPEGRITIRTRQEGDAVLVEIEDDGEGIPPEIEDRVFDAFFTTKPPGEGTGLGLDISYNIVATKHRGDLTFDSEPGRTCFTVRLPLDFTNA
jgi:signal transduction histidine kinase